jgi:hypothetical protein
MLERNDDMKSLFIINVINWELKTSEQYIYYHLKDALNCLEKLCQEYHCKIQYIHDKYYIAKNDKYHITYNEWTVP